MTAPRVATPIRVSVARVADRAAKRLGYRWVAICEICGQAIIIRLDEATKPGPVAPWRHRRDMDADCPPRELEARLVPSDVA